MREVGAPFTPYGQPSHFESKVVRTYASLPGTTGTGSARTPLQALDGMITPNGLHFERSHDGVPDIDPDAHQLLIHGLVRRPLNFNLDALSRYPMVSRIAFLECGGNGGALYQKAPVQLGVQGLQGLLSCAEWTGVPLAVLLDEAGIDPKAKWILAEGADAASMSRSIPLAKAMDDAIVALYQNGERVRPSNGYPMRLLLPGFEGNSNVKWLRRIKLIDGPMMTKGRDLQIHDLAAERQSAAVRLPDRGEVGDHAPVSRTAARWRRGLRDFGIGVVGLWQDRQGRCLRRWRQELGAGDVAGAGAAEGTDAVPHSVAVERRRRPCCKAARWTNPAMSSPAATR